MKIKGSLPLTIIALLLAVTFLPSCGGGGGAVYPGPGGGGGGGGGAPVVGKIVTLAGWDQVQFLVQPLGGTFGFPGGKITFPQGAIPTQTTFSVARSPWNEHMFVFQPEFYTFDKSITVDFNSPEVQVGEESTTAVYQYHKAAPAEVNAYEGFVFNTIENAHCFDGMIRITLTQFSTITFIPDVDKYFRIVYEIPPQFLPPGAVPVRTTRNLWTPGQFGMVNMDHTILGMNPHSEELMQWNSIYEFAAQSTYMGAYMQPGSLAGYNNSTAAAKQLIYRITTGGDLEYTGYYNPDHTLVTGDLITDTYGMTPRGIGDWAEYPWGWFDTGEQVDTITVGNDEGTFYIYAYYVYANPTSGAWLRTPVVPEGSLIPFAYTTQTGDKLRISVNPEYRAPGTYKIQLGGTTPWGSNYRNDVFTVNVVGTTPDYSLNMTPVPETPGSNIASVFFPSVKSGNRARTLLDYNHFSLEIDGEWVDDFNVYTGPQDAIWPVMDVVFVIDTTSSMSNELNQIKSGVWNVLINLDGAGIDYRLGGIEYKNEIMDIFPFTEDVEEFLEWLNSLQASGYYSSPATIDALMTAIYGMDWRRGATRHIVAASDGRVSESVSDYSIGDVISTARDQGIIVNGVYTWYYHPNLSDIAASTGGTWSVNFNLIGINLITASYALWWNDDSPDVVPHFVMVSIYNTPQDKLNNNPSQTVWRMYNY
jgi:hypothetical protein